MNVFSLDALEGAIFDLDGTLIDSMVFWQTMGITYITLKGLEVEPDLNKKLYSLTIIQAAHYLKERYKIDLPHATIVTECNDIMEDAYTTQVHLKSGVKEFLDVLYARGIPMHIATATNRHLVEIALHKFDIAHYFAGIITSTEAGSGKAESPAIFDIARKNIGTPLAQTVVFEDALHAIKTAKQAGYPIAALYDDSAKLDIENIQKISDWYGMSFYDYIDYINISENKKSL